MVYPLLLKRIDRYANIDLRYSLTQKDSFLLFIHCNCSFISRSVCDEIGLNLLNSDLDNDFSCRMSTFSSCIDT